MNAGLLVFILLILLSFVGVPIYTALGIGTMVAMISAGMPVEAIPQKVFAGINSSSLLAIPFFILAGNIMAKGITTKLINVSNSLFGWVRGSMAVVTVVASALFGAISGSAVATTSAIGGTTLPAMEEEGYPPEFAAAVVAASSTLGPLIPPSIGLIVYASLTDTSVTTLFKAAVVPGLLLTLILIGYSLWYGQKHQLPAHPKKRLGEILRVFRDSIWALLMPVIILGCIFTGICTATEAAAIAVIYALVVNGFVYRCISWRELGGMFAEAGIMTATIMLLIGLSNASSYVVVASQLPRLILSVMQNISASKIVMLIFINVVFLILGMLMEGNSATVMMTPLLITMVTAYGVDLIQFGMIEQMNLYIGLLTPPVGLCLLLACKMAGTRLSATLKAVMPMLLLNIVLLLLVTYIPALTLWLPSVVG